MKHEPKFETIIECASRGQKDALIRAFVRLGALHSNDNFSEHIETNGHYILIVPIMGGYKVMAMDTNLIEDGRNAPG